MPGRRFIIGAGAAFVVCVFVIVFISIRPQPRVTAITCDQLHNRMTFQQVEACLGPASAKVIPVADVPHYFAEWEGDQIRVVIMFLRADDTMNFGEVLRKRQDGIEDSERILPARSLWERVTRWFANS